MHPDLIKLLEHRRQVIADHAFRDRDPSAHPDALRNASLAITAWHQEHQNTLHPRLNHFLTQASFDKALLWLHSGGTWTGH